MNCDFSEAGQLFTMRSLVEPRSMIVVLSGAPSSFASTFIIPSTGTAIKITSQEFFISSKLFSSSTKPSSKASLAFCSLLS